MINPFKFLFFFIFLSIQLAAQTKRIDQLKLAINTASNQQERGYAILNLCSDKYSLHGDTMRYYALQAEKIAHELNDNNMLLWSHYYIGYSHVISGELEDAKSKATHLLSTIQFENDKELYAELAILKALACYKGNQPREAMKDMYELLQLTAKDSSSLINIETNNMIALAYSALNQYEESLNWQLKALKLNEEPNQSRTHLELLARTFMGISISYVHLFEGKKHQRFADSSFYYARRADTLCSAHEILFFYCQSQILQGYYYSYAKKADSAEYFLRRGIEKRELLGDPAYQASDMSVLGTFYATTGQYDKGIAICKEALALCEKYQLTIQLFVLLHNALAQNYLGAGNYKMYGETLQHLIHLRDSVNGKLASEEITKIQSNYELKQQEATIAKQNLDIAKKNFQFLGLLAVGTLTACIGLVVFFYYRKKQQLKLEFIQKEEKRLTELSIKEAEEKQRRQIASELHDNIGAQASFINSNIDWIIDSPIDISEEERKMRLRTIHETSKDLMRNLRETLWALNREEITLDELTDKLKVYVQTIAKMRPGTVFYNHEQIEVNFKLNPVQSLNVFRIMQEGVNNILKHSMASEIHLYVHSSNQQFELILMDNGKGFDPSVVEEGHYGLDNMRYRANEAGIEVSISSSLQNGTTIRVAGLNNV